MPGRPSGTWSRWRTAAHSTRAMSPGRFSSSAGAWWRAAPLTFHGLRHSAVSLMLASGADIAVVSKLMRHASIAITADVYSLWSVPSLRKPWTVPRT